MVAYGLNIHCSESVCVLKRKAVLAFSRPFHSNHKKKQRGKESQIVKRKAVLLAQNLIYHEMVGTSCTLLILYSISDV